MLSLSSLSSPTCVSTFSTSTAGVLSTTKPAMRLLISVNWPGLIRRHLGGKLRTGIVYLRKLFYKLKSNKSILDYARLL
jgi:hypothetical protein